MSILDGRKQAFLILGLGIFLGLSVGVIAFSDQALSWLSFLGGRWFIFLVQAVCVASFGFLLFKQAFRFPLVFLLIRIFFAIILLPIIFLPAFRCFFSVPYVFCRVCPNPCPWGVLRTFILGGAVLLNLPAGRVWCSCLCPLGAFQIAQERVVSWHVRLAPFVAVSLYLVLFVVTGMYLLSAFQHPWMRMFEAGWYAWGAASVGVMLVLIFASFVIPRFWCRYFCPVGAIADLTSAFSLKEKKGSSKNT